tara:strand:- start:29070 stop:29945 length:876 start_codon:yes stop_codon:yes gene_type:complete
MEVKLNNFKKTPVVIIHRGFQPYLKYNLEITSKNNEVILIGDSDVKEMTKLNNNLHFIDISYYENNKSINQMKNYFVNFSTNNAEFEWRCFERIFIIKKLLEDQNIKNVFHIDSDAVLLVDVNTLIFNNDCAYMIPSFQDGYRMDSSVHFGLLDINFCKQFHKLYKEIYVDGSKFNLIEGKINHHKINEIKGGICDMTLYYLLNQQNYLEPQNLMKEILDINDKEFIFLNNINLSEGYYDLKNFKMKKNYIDISKRKAYDIIQSKKIKVAGIHFQGSAKRKINRFLKYKLL